MKKKLILSALFIALFFVANAQMKITITLSSQKEAFIDIMQGADRKTDTKDIDLSDNNGQITIINKTADQSFTIYFKSNNGSNFIIKGKMLEVKAGNIDGTTIFKVGSNGKITPAVDNSDFVKGIGIEIRSDSGSIKSIPATDALIKLTTGGSNDATDLFTYVKKQIRKKGYFYIPSQNVIIDNQGTIHIYLDENGNPIFSYYPGTGKENNDRFQFHIVSSENIGYTVQSTGEFKPTAISDEIKGTVATTQSDADGNQQKEKVEYQSPIFGPFSGSFPFTITKNAGGSKSVIVNRSIDLLPTSRVSIGTAVVASWLQNPENIAGFRKPNGDSTLIADNRSTRGFLGLFLTFHFIPRNLNIKPRTTLERLGMTVGTNLNDKSFSNVFLGLNIEITNGLFFNFGTHFGQVNYAVGYDDHFKFGEDKFTGVLETRKKWVLGGPYIAMNIDAALFAKVFKNILGTGANN
jgi:hypothetical protein